MPCFNVSRRFKVISDRFSGRKVIRQVSFDNLESLNSVDDKVLSYLTESIVRELAEKGVLTGQFREKFYSREQAAIESELPAVSLGPSGIKGCYQREI